MDIFVADAFTDKRFGGNPAGVVPLYDAAFPPDACMRQLAAELRHSETAYVRRTGESSFHLRYFTPAAEVDLCGHATIAAFSVLRDHLALPVGDYTAATRAGRLAIRVEANAVWLDMAPGRILKALTRDEALPVYRALGLAAPDAPEDLPVCIVSTGLSDIMLPVRSFERLQTISLERTALTTLSKDYGVCGAHAFSLDDPAVTAHCRNFAPLYDIDEESATGTANGALTYYLLQQGMIRPGGEQRFLQGEAMQRPSVVLSRTDETGRIRIGGNGVACFRGLLV